MLTVHIEMWTALIEMWIAFIEMWTVHIHCKNWKMVFNRKLPMLQGGMFCVVRNIFRRYEAYLEAWNHFNSSMKQVELQWEDGQWIPGQYILLVCVLKFPGSRMWFLGSSVL
jgi:hypothetical protein